MKANKGEWSEFYAFLKILEQRKINAADSDLQTILDKFFVFKKIEKDTKIFDLTQLNIGIYDSNNILLKEFLDKELPNKIIKIFNKIQTAQTTTFEIEEATDLMENLLCSSIKAGSGNKADINGVIYDRISDKEAILGFSVKSMIGGASTLLNAGKTTNFIFEVDNIKSEQITELNSINTKSKVQDRIKSILKNGGKFKFIKVAKQEFESNLKKIDTIAPIIISQMLFDFFQGKANKILDLVGLLQNSELLQLYNLSVADYEFKVKNLLVASALGMVPSKVWDGFTKAHGGYIVIKNDGEVVCYHLYNREEFLTYLYKNTKFESASTSRHDYGKLYEENGKIFFNLNLQIRFIK